MATFLSAISAGGLTGASNQYMYLLLICVGGRMKMLNLTPEMGFMTHDWFIALVGVLWLISVAPSYAPLIAPGLANAANTVSNLMHGFVVPVSSGLIALASAGFVTLDPNASSALTVVQLFDPATGAIEPAGLMVAGGGAMMAMTLNGGKFVAKPGISAATGTTGHVSAPIFATVETLLALVMVGIVTALSQLNPWLLVAFGVVVAVIMVIVMIISLIALYRVGKGIGRVFRLIETQPRAGWALVAEALVWGSGSYIWGQTHHALLRIALWASWVLALIVGTVLWAVPIIGWSLWLMMFVGGLGAGVMWSRGLLKRLEQSGQIVATRATPQPVAVLAASS